MTDIWSPLQQQAIDEMNQGNNRGGILADPHAIHILIESLRFAEHTAIVRQAHLEGVEKTHAESAARRSRYLQQLDRLTLAVHYIDEDAKPQRNGRVSVDGQLFADLIAAWRN